VKNALAYQPRKDFIGMGEEKYGNAIDSLIFLSQITPFKFCPISKLDPML
jgi:hypothetical protein